MGPVAFLLLGMGLTGQFSKVSASDYGQVKADYERVKAEDATLRKTNEELGSAALRYEEQIKRWRVKNPKANDFPAYKGAK